MIVCDRNQEHLQPYGYKSWAERAAKSRGYEGPARHRVILRDLSQHVLVMAHKSIYGTLEIAGECLGK